MTLLTANEEAELGRRAHAGDVAARNELVQRNRGFVLSQMRRYSRICTDDDLLQAGYVGLMEGANVFDPDSHPGMRFLTIAAHYVLMEMRNYLYSRQLVRVPQHLRHGTLKPAVLPKCQRRRQWMEIAIVNAGHKVKYFEQREPSDDDRENWRVPSPVDPRQEPAGAETDDNDSLQRLRAAMSALTEIEADVIRRRFGFTDDCLGRKQTYRSLSRLFGLSHTQIQNIERRALCLLREEITVAAL
jgi:RNA polymerase sigma factor (sigma-70 family)